MRKVLGFTCMLALIAAGADGSVRRRLVNRESLARSAAAAGLGTARNVPHEWGRGAGGFGKRFASGVGRHVVKTAIQAGVGAAHHEDLHYHRSNLEGFGPRLKYAVVSTFWVPRTNRPGHTAALGRISGNMGAGLVSRLWQPASTAGIGAGLASGGIGIGADVGFHVAREFWPRHKSTAPLAANAGRRTSGRLHPSR
jgi:hypothetical protein